MATTMIGGQEVEVPERLRRMSTTRDQFNEFVSEQTQRLRRKKIMSNKPGFAATILTSGIGLEDEDNIRRPTLLGA